MKKAFLCLACVLFSTMTIVATSYLDNEYQKLAMDYAEKAEAAFEEGNYDMAEELCVEAEKNADLSIAYIEDALIEIDSKELLEEAAEKLAWADSINAEKNYPMSYSAGKQAVEDGFGAYEAADFYGARDFAQQALDYFATISEVTPLPKYYVVKPWAQSRDCYWNIAGRSFVYNNPFLWENLYYANKSRMRQPNNPNLIFPGMKMEIPSISGESREGTYDPDKFYGTYGSK